MQHRWGCRRERGYTRNGRCVCILATHRVNRLTKRTGRDAGANAVDDANAFKAGDEGKCGAGRICTGDRHRVGRVEGADQHTHHHFPGAEFPRFRDITDHHGVDGAGCFSNNSKHAFSLVECIRKNLRASASI